MKLDARLKAVANFVAVAKADVSDWTHVDIGSDHGHLLKSLLEQGTITKAIAVEKNEAPLKRTEKALKGREATCFLGDGFVPMEKGVADSASICGLGASTILQILRASPEKIPDRLVLQANKQSDKLRRWAYEHGYHLIDECMVDGFWNYAILLFEKKNDTDSAYSKAVFSKAVFSKDKLDFSLETLFKYGPHLLERRDALLLQTVKSEYEHFKKMDAANDAVNKAIKAQLYEINQVLDYLSRF